MTRLQKAATIIALALCLAGAIGMEVWKASYSPQSPNQSAAAAKNDHTANPQTIEERHQATEEAIARYTLGLTIFTGILAFATAGLGAMNFFQVRLARAEYISSNRPRIVLRDVHLIAETIHYTLVNLGGTPATIIKSWIFTEFVEKQTRFRPLWPAADDGNPTRLRFDGGESKDLQHALPAETSFAIKHPYAVEIAIEDKPGFFGKIYFVGALIYEDDLGMKRRSRFRRLWNPNSLTFVRLIPEEERDHEYAD